VLVLGVALAGGVSATLLVAVATDTESALVGGGLEPPQAATPNNTAGHHMLVMLVRANA
jgi:hypothetical protein